MYPSADDWSFADIANNVDGARGQRLEAAGRGDELVSALASELSTAIRKNPEVRTRQGAEARATGTLLGRAERADPLAEACSTPAA